MPQRTDQSGEWSLRISPVSVVALILLLSISVYSQISKDKSEASKGRNEGYKIGVNVDLVLMYASVFDKNGHFVEGLKQKNKH